MLVVEDGPTLTHGSMKIGAGVVAAERNGAAEIVDPRPWAFGTIAETFEKYDVGAVLPAMGYSDGQLAEMEKIIDAADVDLVVIGTPIDLRSVIDIRKPAVRVRYDLEMLPGSPAAVPSPTILRPVLAAGATEGCAWNGSSSPWAATRCSVAAPRTRTRRCTAPLGRRPSGSPTSRRPGGRSCSPTATGRRSGRILLQQEAAAESCNPMPLDVCGAESQGQIGYLLQVTIGDVFFERGMERPVATVLTLTRVRADDPAFADPTKFVGPYLRGAGGATARGASAATR